MTKFDIDPNDLFGLLVAQLSSSARTQLGKSPNPVTGKLEKNIEAAKMTIGILESLLFKTAGNLSKKEHETLSKAVRDLKSSLVNEEQ